MSQNYIINFSKYIPVTFSKIFDVFTERIHLHTMCSTPFYYRMRMRAHGTKLEVWFCTALDVGELLPVINPWTLWTLKIRIGLGQATSRYEIARVDSVQYQINLAWLFYYNKQLGDNVFCCFFFLG